MKNKKGFALVYTVLTMLLVFAICMLITTIMLAQITYYKTYSDKSDENTTISQIGELFVSSKGNFYDCTSGTYNNTDGAKTTPFAQTLAATCNIEGMQAVFSGDIEDLVGSDKSIIWENIKYGLYTFRFQLSHIQDSNDSSACDNTLIISDANASSRTYLLVTVHVQNDNVQIMDWFRGDE